MSAWVSTTFDPRLDWSRYDQRSCSSVTCCCIFPPLAWWSCVARTRERVAQTRRKNACETWTEEDAELNARDEPRPSQEAHRAPKPPVVRYLVALAATAAGVLVTVALYQSSVSDKPIYAPLLAAVALTSWYGGFGPSALVVVLGWSAALLVLAAPGEDIAFSNSDDLVRWLINLLV